jgi:hypothetical protein
MCEAGVAHPTAPNDQVWDAVDGINRGLGNCSTTDPFNPGRPVLVAFSAGNPSVPPDYEGERRWGGGRWNCCLLLCGAGKEGGCTVFARASAR